MAFRIVAALMLATGIATVPATAANLVTNGSFENASGFSPPADNTMSLSSGATTLTGWTVLGDALAWIGPANPFSLTASDGSYFLDLTDYQLGAPFGGVQQSIATVSGHIYRVSFDLGSDVRTAVSSIDVSVGGPTQTFTSSTPTVSDIWESRTFDFAATSASTILSLTGAVGSHYIGLDNIVVTDLGLAGAVPEPASWALLIVGFGSIGAAMRRSPRRAGSGAPMDVDIDLQIRQ